MQNNYILITGASSDLGASSAKVLSKEHKIVLSGRDKNKLEAIKIQLDNPSNHIIWEVDLLSDKIGDSLSFFLKEKDICISGFIHFAGFFKVSPLRLVKEEEVLDSFKINVISAIQISSVLAKKKFKKELKDVIFISSISALKGKAGFSVYASAKAALSGLTKNLAIELAPIHVNLLTLGAIPTKKTIGLLEPIKDSLDEHIPLNLGTTQQVSKWIHFLMNNSDKWVTGQEFIIDGGDTVL